MKKRNRHTDISLTNSVKGKNINDSFNFSYELWFHIFTLGEFTALELLCLSRVSRLYYQIAFDYRLWKKHLPPELTKEQYSPALYQLFALRFGSSFRNEILWKLELNKNLSSLIYWGKNQHNIPYFSKRFEDVLSPLAIVMRDSNILLHLKKKTKHKLFFSVAQWEAIIATFDVNLFEICQKRELEKFKLPVIKLFQFAATEGAFTVLKMLWVDNQVEQPDMLKSNDYLAFRQAAANGHLQILKWLWSLSTTEQQPMLQANNYAAFRYAAANGHIQILKWLWSLSTIEQQQAMLQAEQYDGFCRAAAFAEMVVLEWLWEVGQTHRQAMLHASNDKEGSQEYKAFIGTMYCGHIVVMEWLWSRATYEQQQAMLQLSEFATGFGYSPIPNHHLVMAWLWSKATDAQRQEILQSNAYDNWFCEAAYQGNLSGMQWLWSKATVEQQCLMLEMNNFRAFTRAVENGHNVVLEWLWSIAAVEQQKMMLEMYDFDAFKNATKAGHIEVLKWLWSKAESYQKQSLTQPAYYNNFFCLAARNGHVSVMEWLWSMASNDQQQAMLQWKDYDAFFYLSRRDNYDDNAHILVLEWLWSKFSYKQQQAVLQSEKCCHKFATLAYLGCIFSLEWLWLKISHEQQQIILDPQDKYYLFHHAANNYPDPEKKIWVVMWLWDLLPVSQDLNKLPISYQNVLKNDFTQILEKKVTRFIINISETDNIQDLENTLAKLKSLGKDFFGEEESNYFINRVETTLNIANSELNTQNCLLDKESKLANQQQEISMQHVEKVRKIIPHEIRTPYQLFYHENSDHKNSEVVEPITASVSDKQNFNDNSSLFA
ncbi:MAG: hypothetical protein ACK4PR_03465 [Gammaproteobacteria bacterium]